MEEIDSSVTIEENVKMGKNVQIGKSVTIYSETIIGDNVIIGNNSEIGYPHITKPRLENLKLKETIIGDNVLIRNNCTIYKGCEIGTNTKIHHNVIMREKTIIGPDSNIGTFNLIEGYSTIGHHTSIFSQCHITAFSSIGNYVFIAPFFICSNDPYMGYRRDTPKEYKGITIHDGVRIAIGVKALPGLTIGKEAMIGAGALVTKDIGAYQIAVGSPAKEKGEISDSEKLNCIFSE